MKLASFPALVGGAAFVASVVLIAQDTVRLPSRPHHELLAAASLGLIAIAYLAFQAVRRPAALEWMQAVMLASAFLFWAANQLYAELPQALLFNDVAVALFVLDVLLVIVRRPRAGSPAAPARSNPR